MGAERPPWKVRYFVYFDRRTHGALLTCRKDGKVYMKNLDGRSRAIVEKKVAEFLSQAQ